MACHGIPIRKPMLAPDLGVVAQRTSRCAVIQAAGVAHHPIRLVALEVHHSRTGGSHEQHQRLRDDGVEPVLRARERQTEASVAVALAQSADLGRELRGTGIDTLLKKDRCRARGRLQASAPKP
jgi:hypothetical protein